MVFTFPSLETPVFPGVITGNPGTISSTDAQRLALLYEAGLNRRADVAGLNFWIDQFEAGRSILNIADSISRSTEFTTAFGPVTTLSNASFISVLYRNVLGRDGEPAGTQFWIGQLQNGAGREKILLDFATSPENQTGSAYVFNLTNNGSGEWLF